MSKAKKPPKWLASLPLAPEYYPTETEFSDPIAFISKIEKEASQFGICKIIPPLPKPSKRFVFSNLGKSISPASSQTPKFTTRHQEIGQRSQPHLHKQQVWQSGEYYTLEQFESKSKAFRRTQFESFKEVTPILVESLFWNAACEQPIYVEYANDVPGSGFSVYKKSRKMATELSNSPWNLQAIAKSPGSLTRFMMDEIPGVTSPMVYIGMLFSWFAWHIEDHELHSLNFLHLGAAKTWYAVPGEYASELEEVVRVEAYGGDYDRLEAFTMLGEKTTLLSPEVIVKSGIPCCRLVQHPGEFVVTFPKAYHVGFSHGFNCGEAANFATPQWLKVAKDAAIRRAAMNYLPMLSHQQLLYMLTVSFVSRIPRELLSGVRSSRLADRKREEREMLVKKAFLNDIQNENNRLCSLLQKNSTSHVVLWEPDLLSNSTAPPLVIQQKVGDGKENLDSVSDKISLQSDSISSVELLEILDAEDDDLPCGLNIDSGTLACVACGVLGYPFMAVVQPHDTTKVMLESERPCSVSRVSQNHDQISISSPVKPDQVPTSEAADDDIMLVKTSTGEKSECVSYHEYNRPRIFCLQHALEVDELLRTKGGAKTMIICHSDYLKIKAYIQAISEEVGMGLNIKDASLENTSPSDLNLISSSIDDGEHEEQHNEDWTASIGVNLKYFLELRKQSETKQEQLTSALGRIFSDSPSRSGISTLRWNSRKLRSSYKVVGTSVAKSRIDADLHKIGISDVSNEMVDDTIGCSSNNIPNETDNSSDSLVISRMNDSTVVTVSDHIDDLQNIQIITSVEGIEKHQKVSIDDYSGTNVHLLEKEEDSAVKFLDNCEVDSPINPESPSKIEAFIEMNAENDDSNTEPTCQDIITCSSNQEEIEGSTSEEHKQEKSASHDLAMLMEKNVGNLCTALCCNMQEETRETYNNLQTNTDDMQLDVPKLMDAHTVSEFETQVKDRPSNETGINSKVILFKTAIEMQKSETSLNSEEYYFGNREALCVKKYSRKRFKERKPEQDQTLCTSQRKNRRVLNNSNSENVAEGFMRSPCEGLRPRKQDCRVNMEDQCRYKDRRKRSEIEKDANVQKKEYRCRWKVCKMPFKSSWARTEHERIHTGERPYECKVAECKSTFRYYADFWRHKKKTGQSVNASLFLLSPLVTVSNLSLSVLFPFFF